MNQQNQSNKIQNPAVQIEKTPQMNDRDFTNDMLATEKYITDAYSTALNEASHPFSISRYFVDFQRNTKLSTRNVRIDV